MDDTRLYNIELFARLGKLDELKNLLDTNCNQSEIDKALDVAIAYSHIPVAEYLLSLGAEFSRYNYDGVYYAVHNDEIEGLKYSISKGVDINVNNGMLLNTSIITAINSKRVEIVKWLLDNGADTKHLTADSVDIIAKYGTEELKELIKNVI